MKKGLTLLVPQELSLPPDKAREVDLALQDGKNIVFIKVLPSVDRRRLTEALMSAVSLQGYADKIYLAMPKRYRTMIDGSLLVGHGIGLLLVDSSGRIEEALPAVAKPRALPASTTELQRALDRIEKLEEGLEELRNQIAELRSALRDLERLRSRLDELYAELRRLRAQIPAAGAPAPAPRAAEEISPPSAPISDEELPSYLRDNPWLQVLARRGREA